MELNDAFIEQAEAVAEAVREAALSNVRKALRPEQVQNADGTWPHPECEDCGEDIPLGRLSLGKIRCIFCQNVRGGRVLR